jgi:predicted phage tail protein
MLRKIKLYGQLAKFIGRRVLEADVATAAEAVRMLAANFPGLEKHMADQHYRVTVGTYDLTLDEIHDPAGQQDIKIVPVIAGAGGEVGRILAGVALIALAAFVPIAVFGIALNSAVLGIGASLVLGGVAQLLAPVPRVPQGPGSDNDPRKTFNFSGIQQTSRQGVPVPCVYGLTLVGSVVISAGVDTVQVQALSGTGSPVLDFILQI